MQQSPLCVRFSLSLCVQGEQWYPAKDAGPEPHPAPQIPKFPQRGRIPGTRKSCTRIWDRKKTPKDIAALSGSFSSPERDPVNISLLILLIPTGAHCQQGVKPKTCCTRILLGADPGPGALPSTSHPGVPFLPPQPLYGVQAPSRKQPHGFFSTAASCRISGSYLPFPDVSPITF